MASSSTGAIRSRLHVIASSLPCKKERHEGSLLQSIIESIWGEEKKYRRKFVALQKKNTAALFELILIGFMPLLLRWIRIIVNHIHSIQKDLETQLKNKKQHLQHNSINSLFKSHFTVRVSLPCFNVSVNSSCCYQGWIRLKEEHVWSVFFSRNEKKSAHQHRCKMFQRHTCELMLFLFKNTHFFQIKRINKKCVCTL